MGPAPDEDEDGDKSQEQTFQNKSLEFSRETNDQQQKATMQK